MDDLLLKIHEESKTRKHIIAGLFSDENIQRKEESLRVFKFYKNNHKDYMINCLCEEYGGDRKKVLSNRNIFSVNITKKIVDATSTVYLDEPERTLIDANEQQEELVAKAYDLSGADKALKKSNKYLSLDHQAIIKVTPVDGVPTARVLPKHMYDVVVSPEDCETAIANITMRLKPEAKKSHIELNIDNAEDYIYTWWTDEYNFETDADGTVIGEAVVNPIGMMPFIEVSKDKDLEYWVNEGSSIIEFSKEFLLCLCDVANIAKLQGFAQAVLASESKPQDLEIGPNNYIHLQLNENSAVQPSFSFASPNPDLNASLSFLEKMLSMFLTSINVDPSTVSSTGQAQRFSSGIDRFLAGVERYEASRDTIALFDSVEQKMFKIIVKWLNALQGTDGFSPELQGPQIGEDVSVSVKFAEPQLVQTEKERCEIITTKLNAGLITKAEAVAKDRGIDIEAAKLVVEEIAQQNSEPVIIEENSDEDA